MSTNRFNCCNPPQEPLGLLIRGGGAKGIYGSYRQDMYGTLFNGPRLKFWKSEPVSCAPCDSEGIHGLITVAGKNLPYSAKTVTTTDITGNPLCVSVNFFPVPYGVTASEGWKDQSSWDLSKDERNKLPYCEWPAAIIRLEKNEYIPRPCDCFTDAVYNSSKKDDFGNYIATNLRQICENYRIGANLAYISFNEGLIGEHETSIQRGDGRVLAPGGLATNYEKLGHIDSTDLFFFHTQNYQNTYMVPSRYTDSGALAVPLVGPIPKLKTYQTKLLNPKSENYYTSWKNYRLFSLLNGGLLYTDGYADAILAGVTFLNITFKPTGFPAFTAPYFEELKHNVIYEDYKLVTKQPEYTGPSLVPSTPSPCDHCRGGFWWNTDPCGVSGYTGGNPCVPEYEIKSYLEKPEESTWLATPNITKLDDTLYRKNRAKRTLMFWTVEKDLSPFDASGEDKCVIPEDLGCGSGQPQTKMCNYTGDAGDDCKGCICKETAFRAPDEAVKESPVALCNRYKGPHVYSIEPVGINVSSRRFTFKPYGTTKNITVQLIVPKSYKDPYPPELSPCPIPPCWYCTSRFGTNSSYLQYYPAGPSIDELAVTDMGVTVTRWAKENGITATDNFKVGVSCNKTPGSDCSPIGEYTSGVKDCKQGKSNNPKVCVSWLRETTVCTPCCNYDDANCPGSSTNEDVCVSRYGECIGRDVGPVTQTRLIKQGVDFDPRGYDICDCPEQHTVYTANLCSAIGEDGFPLCSRTYNPSVADSSITTWDYYKTWSRFCTEFPDAEQCSSVETNKCFDDCGNPEECCPTEYYKSCIGKDVTKWEYNPTLFYYDENNSDLHYEKLVGKIGDKLYAFNPSKCLHGLSLDCNTQTYCQSEMLIDSKQYLKTFPTSIWGPNAEYGDLTLKIKNKQYPNAFTFNEMFGGDPLRNVPSRRSNPDYENLVKQIKTVLQTRESEFPETNDPNYWLKRSIYELADIFSTRFTTGITGITLGGYYPNLGSIPDLSVSNKILTIDGKDGSISITESSFYDLNYFWPNPYMAIDLINYR